MRFDTPRFGTVEVAEDRILRFGGGLPGFPLCKRFIVMDHDRDTPLKWLQCVDVPDVAFPVVEPEQVLPSYELDVPPETLTVIGWKETDDPTSISVFLILNVSDGNLTANLRAPIVVNLDNHCAHQLILDGADADLRHPIRPE